MSFHLAMALAVCWAEAAAIQKKHKTQAAVQRLQGTWVVVAEEQGGRRLALADYQGKQLVFADDRVSIEQSRSSHEGGFELELSANPKEFTLWLNCHKSRKEMDGKELTFVVYCMARASGTYELQKDSLKLSLPATVYTKGGRCRLDCFKTTPADGPVTLTFRRETR